VPPPPRTSPLSHLRRTSPSTRRSGEPLPPPSCQACCRHPHGAHAASPATPRPSASPGRPCHHGRAKRGDCEGESTGRAVSFGLTGLLCHWVRLEAESRATVRPRTVGLGYKFSFSFIILEICINLKNAWKIQYHLEK
jgi:hypothetical protein